MRDLAIVDASILHIAHHKTRGTKPLSHVQFLTQLHLEQIQLKETDIHEDNTFGQGECLRTRSARALSAVDLTMDCANG